VRQNRSPRHRAADTALPKKTLLWIDDYEPALMVYQAIFEKLGFRVITAPRPALGLQVAASQHLDAVISDYEMPEMNGASVAVALKRGHPHLPVIFFTGTHSLPSGVKNLADAFCDKAAPLQRLLATLDRLLVKKPSQSLQPRALRPPSEQGQRTFA
jgi:DNA-binding NtrC family response regulator